MCVQFGSKNDASMIDRGECFVIGIIVYRYDGVFMMRELIGDGGLCQSEEV